MSFNLNETVELTFTVDPDETPTVTVTAPDGTVSTPAVTGSAGSYTALVDANQAGTWTFVWSTPNGGDETGSFLVGSTGFTADPEDVADLLMRDLTAAETVATRRLLDKARGRILAAVPTVPDRIAAGTLSAAVVQDVQVEMVLRVLRNPNGYRQETQSIDDFTHSWTVDSALSAGALYVTPDEVALLSPVVTPFVGSIRLGYPV